MWAVPFLVCESFFIVLCVKYIMFTFVWGNEYIYTAFLVHFSCLSSAIHDLKFLLWSKKGTLKFFGQLAPMWSRRREAEVKLEIHQQSTVEMELNSLLQLSSAWDLQCCWEEGREGKRIGVRFSAGLKLIFSTSTWSPLTITNHVSSFLSPFYTWKGVKCNNLVGPGEVWDGFRYTKA